MFHLPDPASASTPQSSASAPQSSASAPQSSAPPTVQMDETAVVVEALLLLSYPVDPPTVKDLRTMVSIYEAIVKLQAEQRCKWWIRMTVEKLIPVNPWAMYAVLLALGRKSCNYNFEEEIRIAARGTLGRPIVRPWDEACLITAADYDRLLVYHSKCRDTFLGIHEEIWRKAGTRWVWFNPHCSSGRAIMVGKSYVPVTQWFLDFLSRAKKTFCKEFREEAIEDVSLWEDLLDRDREAGELCLTCAKSSASRMPAYAKDLARLFGEAISPVSCVCAQLRHVGC